MDLVPHEFLGLPLLVGDPHAAADWLIEQATRPAQIPKIVEHMNVYNYFQIHRRPDLERDLAERAVLLFEGIGIKVGAFVHSGEWLSDLNGTDLFPLVAERACNAHVPIYFLGGSRNIIRAAAERCCSRFPGLQLVGYEDGFFTKESEPNVVRRMNLSGAKILLVGLGSPLQDEFALRRFAELRVAVVWAVGGLFDFLSETKPRAPSLVRRLRLERLYRFALEPRRTWFRNVPVPLWYALHVLSLRAEDGRRA